MIAVAVGVVVVGVADGFAAVVMWWAQWRSVADLQYISARLKENASPVRER